MVSCNGVRKQPPGVAGNIPRHLKSNIPPYSVVSSTDVQHHERPNVAYTVALPVYWDLCPRNLKKRTAPYRALMNHRIMLIKSIQTAFFILCTPESPSAFAWI